MNNSDLKRILNKLTAAATPLPNDGIPEAFPDVPIDDSLIDHCKELADFRPAEAIFNKIIILPFLTTPNRQSLPETRRSKMSSIFYEVLMDYIKMFCRCRAQQKRLGTLAPDRTDRASFYEILRTVQQPIIINGGMNPENNVRIAALLANGCSMLLLAGIGINIFPNGINKFCDDGGRLPNDGLNQARVYMAQTQAPLLDELYEFILSVATPADTTVACAEPKVAIIEDYLVEQGLAIGVAGILGATALGLYLRGNRAAAVALIATATAAVGGTATGAESVMNDVETDYNRSVRFGGQQDCRDSNQTGNEMSAGD